MGKKRWYTHTDCGGPVLFTLLLDREHGQCSHCGKIGWVEHSEIKEGEVRLAGVSDAETAQLLALAEKALKPQSYASCFETKRLHIGDSTLEGKRIYCEVCECKFCLKERVKLEKGKEIN